MPPPENTNQNRLNVDTLRVGIDPIFKGNPSQINNPAPKNISNSAFNVLNNQEYTPGSTSPNNIPVQSASETNNQARPVVRNSIIRTFKSDMEAVIQADHLSSINIAIAENQKMNAEIRTNQNREESTSTWISDYSLGKILIFLSLILIIFGIAVVVFFYLNTKQNRISIVTNTEIPALITTEYRDELNIDIIAKNLFTATLASRINDLQIPTNNFYSTYLVTTDASSTKKFLTAQEFVSLVGFRIPDKIKRTLLPDFMIGTFSYGVNLPFIILKTSYFENAYSGMLEWEDYLEKDFQTLFKLNIFEESLNPLTETVASTTLAVETPGFKDAVIINKDIRLLRDSSGQISFLYGIIDKETIVITVSDRAFKEIINRLNNEKSLRR